MGRMLWGAVLLWAAMGMAQAMSASADARGLARWVMKSSDHGGRPFAIVDKKNARMYLFDATGHLRGASAVLLGQAVGDHSAPGVGDHAQSGKVPMHERTTPSGRFVSEPGRSARGEHIVWVDYESAFAIHRVRPGPSMKHREARLASPTARDNRASWGCVVVPVSFYKKVVARYLGHGRGIVYVMPEAGNPG